MFGVSHYNPDEPRDWHGRWTSDGSSWRNAPLSDPSRVGRADLLLGHGRFGAWQRGLIREFVLPTPAEAQRFSRLLTAWNAASDLDDETFRDLFIDGLDIAPATLHRLRDAAAGSAQAETMGQMIQASTPLTDAIKAIGVDRWDRMLAGLEDRADAAMPKSSGSGNRTASRDHEDQPIDSEPGKPSSLLRLAAFDSPEDPLADLRHMAQGQYLRWYLADLGAQSVLVEPALMIGLAWKTRCRGWQPHRPGWSVPKPWRKILISSATPSRRT